jgi:hypothetical protein
MKLISESRKANICHIFPINNDLKQGDNYSLLNFA